MLSPAEQKEREQKEREQKEREQKEREQKERQRQRKIAKYRRKLARLEQGPHVAVSDHILPRAVRELPLFQFDTRNPVLKDHVPLTKWVMWKVLETYGCLQTIGKLDMSEGMRENGTLISGGVQQGKSETIILHMWVVWIQLGYCGILLLRNTGSRDQRVDIVGSELQHEVMYRTLPKLTHIINSLMQENHASDMSSEELKTVIRMMTLMVVDAKQPILHDLPRGQIYVEGVNQATVKKLYDRMSQWLPAWTAKFGAEVGQIPVIVHVDEADENIQSHDVAQAGVRQDMVNRLLSVNIIEGASWMAELKPLMRSFSTATVQAWAAVLRQVVPTVVRVPVRPYYYGLDPDLPANRQIQMIPVAMPEQDNFGRPTSLDEHPGIEPMLEDGLAYCTAGGSFYGLVLADTKRASHENIAWDILEWHAERNLECMVTLYNRAEAKQFVSYITEGLARRVPRADDIKQSTYGKRLSNGWRVIELQIAGRYQRTRDVRLEMESRGHLMAFPEYCIGGVMAGRGHDFGNSKRQRKPNAMYLFAAPGQNYAEFLIQAVRAAGINPPESRGPIPRAGDDFGKRVYAPQHVIDAILNGVKNIKLMIGAFESATPGDPVEPILQSLELTKCILNVEGSDKLVAKFNNAHARTLGTSRPKTMIGWKHSSMLKTPASLGQEEASQTSVVTKIDVPTEFDEVLKHGVEDYIHLIPDITHVDQVMTTVVQVDVDDGAISEWEGYREAGRGGNPRGLLIHTRLRSTQEDMFGFRGGVQEIRTTQTNLTNNKAPYKHDDDQYWVSSWVFDRDQKRAIVIMRTMTYDKYKQSLPGPRLFHRFTPNFDGVETYVEKLQTSSSIIIAAIQKIVQRTGRDVVSLTELGEDEAAGPIINACNRRIIREMAADGGPLEHVGSGLYKLN